MNKYIHRFIPIPPELCICHFNNGHIVPIAFETDSKLESASFIYLCNNNPDIQHFWFSTIFEYSFLYQNFPDDIIDEIYERTEIL